MTWREIWISDSGQIRAPWRLLIFLLALSSAAVLLTAMLEPLAAALPLHQDIRLALTFTALVGAAAFAHVVCVRLVERRDWRMVWLDRAAAMPRIVMAAALGGALAIALPVALLLAIGWFALLPSESGSSLAMAAAMGAMLLPAALWEELVFRGYPFAVLREWGGSAFAVAISSALFGLLHAANPGASVRTISIVVAAGIVLGLIVLRTASLYAAWAAHFGWNWTMATLFHAPVSGAAFGVPDYRLADTGPDWATGGTWGPEGGLAAVCGMGVATFLIVARHRRQRGR